MFKLKESLKQKKQKLVSKIEKANELIEVTTAKLQNDFDKFSEQISNNFNQESDESNVLKTKEEEVFAQEWFDQIYPKEGVCLIDDGWGNKGKRRDEIRILIIVQKNLKGDLDLSGFFNLDYLQCWENNLTSLNLKGCSKLENLVCRINKLTQLVLPPNNKLQSIKANNNLLTSFDHDILNPETLTDLRLFNNNLESANIEVFSHLVNLVSLSIGNEEDYLEKGNLDNKFFGSLKSFKNLSKLERLELINTDINEGLQYLPLTLQKINCNDKIGEALEIYGFNLRQWQAHHPELMVQAEKNPICIIDSIHELKVKKAFSIASTPILEENVVGKLSHYSNFLIKDIHPFNWKIKGELSNLLKENLPIRLYHIPTNTVVWTKNHSNISSYAMLSYAWGKLEDETNRDTWEYTYVNKEGNPVPKQLGVYPEHHTSGTTKESIQALKKAIAAIKFLNNQHNANIEYLWMDQLCIDQFNNKEKELEVPKMRQYYSRATVTLIAIDANLGTIDKSNEVILIKHIISKVYTSFWFTRSWTFQEGVLSKQTIFMFDDGLVDGRRLALAWGGSQASYNREQHVFITPFGWSYTNNFGQSINLNLGETLLATSHRLQTIPIDSVYSILGLMPYGDQVKVEYKEVSDYAKEDLETKLLELIEKAYLHNSKEIIFYLGDRNPDNWWLPFIDESGKIQIMSTLNEDDEYDQYFLSQIKQVTKQGIQLIGHYTLLENGIKVVELDKNDKESDGETIQFILTEEKSTNPPSAIIRTKESFYLEGQEPQKMFIDMIERDVIIKSENPEKYKKMVSDDSLINQIEQRFLNFFN